MDSEKAHTFAVIAVAAVLLATSALTLTPTNNAIAYKKNQATSQANDCGNEFFPINIGCQNTGSQIQGDENAVAQAAQQTFPQVEIESKKKVKPVPPVDVGCPENTRWDATTTEDGTVPSGTVICFFEGLGPQIAFVGPDGINEDVSVNPTPINQGSDPCPGSFQEAEVTSEGPLELGGIPHPLEFGGPLCVDVD